MTGPLLDGRPCTADEAIAAAARLLAEARAPLVWGLVGSTVEAQREAVRIAELLGGCVDSAASTGHAASSAAFEQLGLLTASLGEIRRADLVAFWGCDPEPRHPGFVARYSPAGDGRTRLAIDLGDARGPMQAEERLALPAALEVESLLVLRAFVRGRRVEARRAAGLPVDALRALAGRLAGCRYGIIIYDADPPRARREPERAHGLTALVRDARARARLRLVGVQSAGNPAGAENVLLWRTGFPAAVSFARGAPRYGPGEFTGECLLARGDVDAALLVGADPGTELGAEARAHLGRIPSVRLGAVASEAASVFIPTAAFEDTAGAVFRMDGIAVRHAALRRSALPSEAAVLSRIATVLASQGARP